MIHAKGLSFSYGKHRIIDRLDFDAVRGECVVFAGPNGSGKSTVLALAAGILKPKEGSVRVNAKIGYVPQGTSLFEDATVEENLRFFADMSHTSVPARLPFDLERFRKKRISELSGGMKKQVSIACAMLGNPEVILLDEPCTALDISFRTELINTVLSWKREGRTVLYVGHDPSEFYPFFDKLIFLSDKPVTYDRQTLSCESEAAFADDFKRLFRLEY